MNSQKKSRPLTHFAWLSIAAAISTIAIKTLAYFITNSVGLLSDALESCINLAGAVMALSMLIIASKPADDKHNFGHSKAEYFSSGVEGLLIILAAIFIAITAIQRFITPQPVDQLGIGIAVSLGASVINLVVSIILSKAGKKYNSITLEADAKHLMTDVWTSAGVILGIGIVALTGWTRMDPIIAFLVAVNIIWAGYGILNKSVSGLMDKALNDEELQTINDVLAKYELRGAQFHALLTRSAGARQFISFHVLVPGEWSVYKGHQFTEEIENEIHQLIPNSIVSTHLEALEDPASFEDISMERNLRIDF